MPSIEFQRRMIMSHPSILECGMILYNHLPFNNYISAKNNKIIANKSLLRKCKITIKGENNVLRINDYSRLYKTKINISGNNNVVVIGEYCTITNGDFCIEDDNNRITIGCHTSINGKTHLACIEGTSILVGEYCMFSSDISVRTGDSHSILDMVGKRVNRSSNVIIGNHVWVGNKATILESVQIPNDCIIGTGAIVTESFSDTNIVIAEVPAKIISREKQWIVKRISMQSNEKHEDTL